MGTKFKTLDAYIEYLYAEIKFMRKDPTFYNERMLNFDNFLHDALTQKFNTEQEHTTTINYPLYPYPYYPYYDDAYARPPRKVTCETETSAGNTTK